MNFFDSYYETGAKMRSKRSRQEFFSAIIEFYYEGTEPTFKTEAAQIGWEGIKYTLAGSRKQRLNRLNPSSDGISDENQTETSPEPSENQAETTTEPEPNREGTSGEPGPNQTETQVIVKVIEPNGSTPYSPPQPSFADQCLMALNGELGRDYASMPAKCRRELSAAEGRVTVDEVRAMVAYKRDDWRGTKFANGLTPNTLFSPEHFSQYLGQAAEAAGAAPAAEWGGATWE